MRVIRVGTRGSRLALAQTGMIARRIEELHPGLGIETVTIKTTGDARQNVPFAAVGTKGMFVKEIEEALLAGSIDFAVHSMKDMPGELAEGLALAATPEREDARDAFVGSAPALADLQSSARVGTSSLRRRAQLLRARPDIEVDELRGNIDTRLRKLDEGSYDAIILASAGLERLGMADRIRQRLPIEQFVPAPGQGVLALEIRRDDSEMAALLDPLNDADTLDAVRAERAFQAALNVGCAYPVGGHAIIQEEQIRFLAMIGAPDGTAHAQIEMSGDRAAAEELGRSAARELLQSGLARNLVMDG